MIHQPCPFVNRMCDKKQSDFTGNPKTICQIVTNFTACIWYVILFCGRRRFHLCLCNVCFQLADKFLFLRIP